MFCPFSSSVHFLLDTPYYWAENAGDIRLSEEQFQKAAPTR
jgi:hypothetical protein